MELIPGIVSLAALVVTVTVAGRLFKAATAVEWVICGFVAVTGQLVAVGIILSELRLLSDVAWWTVLNAGVALLAVATVLAFPRLRRRGLTPFTLPRVFSRLRRWYRGLPRFEKAVLCLLLAATLLVNLLNLGVVVFTAPHNWDSMVFHLTRMAYWLQHGTFDYYEANYWAQVVHQKLKGLLLLFVFLSTGRNENLTQLVQYCAYWVAVVSIYGIGRAMGVKCSAALFSSLVFALLIECLMQSTTPQSDLLLTAYIGCALYALFSFRQTRRTRYLGLGGVSIGLALATKPPGFLLLPGLFIVGVYVLGTGRSSLSRKARQGGVLAASLLLSFVVFALPTGYGENRRIFGHPMGPPALRAYHSFEGRSIPYILVNGTKNIGRYLSDSLSLDGLPPVEPVLRVQAALKSIPRAVFGALKITMEAPEGEGTREGPFVFYRPPYSHADYSYWGVLGFALLWPAVLLVLFGLRKVPGGWVLAAAVVLFLLMQAYSGPYSPNRGRYFVEPAIFAAPLVGGLFPGRRRLIRGWLLVVVALGCLSALTAVLFRYRSPILSEHSVFRKTRLEQVLRDGPIFQAPIRRFEELVPADVVVAACLNENSYEYPLFGYKLTRKIIPLNSFWRGLQPVPAEADYLLWADDFDEVFNRRESDIHLGKDWYLRKLK